MVAIPTNDLRMATISGRVELAKTSRMGWMYSWSKEEVRTRAERRRRRTHLNPRHRRPFFFYGRSTGNSRLNTTAALIRVC